MNVYISGPIPNLDPETTNQEVFSEFTLNRRFAEAVNIVRGRGHTPIVAQGHGVPTASPMAKHLTSSLPLLLEADAVLMLYDWNLCRRCRLEHETATTANMVIYHSFLSFNRSV